MIRGGAALVAAAAVAAAALSGCRSCGSGPGHRRAVVVFAAASLTDAFGALAHRFEAEHPGVHVTVSEAGSQALRVQIENGAPADVFASANARYVDALAADKLVAARAPFAQNHLVIVVPAKNPANLRTVADLPRAGRIVVGAAAVPIGAYTRAFLRRAAARYGPDFRRDVEAHVASRELSVRQVLAKVVLGEADAAVVYRTDAAAARGKVIAIPIPPRLDVVSHYHIAVLARAPHPALARAWFAFVRSPAGRAVLARYGFDTAAGAAGAGRGAPP